MNKSKKVMPWVHMVILGVIGIVFLSPLVWMMFSSLKTTTEVFSTSFKLLPNIPQWHNYVFVWQESEISMLRAYGNTIFITVFGTVVQLLISSLAAYAFAKIRFKGKNFVFFLFLSTMMVPVEVTILPRFTLFNTIGLYNNLWAVILPHWFSATSIFMLRQFYMGLPDDLMEAAKIDGATHPTIFMRVMLPLTRTALVSLMVLAIVSCWNEYLSPLIFLVNTKLYTVSQTIRWYMLDDLQRYELVMAAATSAIVPILILFIASQKSFVEGIATSGVKG
ncbi:MAG: carbohydrate ABC transporter permease [Clostridia bacterium]|nr:carbohydrate ABC transporter permease [Clostridia bacterium]